MADWEELIEAYENEVDILSASYEMMGILLNSEAVADKLRERAISELYIYGGGYLGIQFYKAINKAVKVHAIVDKSGGLNIEVPEKIPVISLEAFEKTYQGQAVVITPVKYYYAIQKDLLRFVAKEKLLYLGELLGGIR